MFILTLTRIWSKTPDMCTSSCCSSTWVWKNQNLLVQENQNLLVQRNQNLLVQENQNLLVQRNHNLLVQKNQNLVVQKNQNLLLQENQNLLLTVLIHLSCRGACWETSGGERGCRGWVRGQQIKVCV